MKKSNFKNFRLNATLSGVANEKMTLHKVNKEWRVAIIFLWLAKLATVAFSMLAGYSFFLFIYKPVLQSDAKAVVLSIITLIILEVLTAVFLEKTFKFLYRQRFITAVSAFLAVLVFYSVSFISSTNGLAQRQSTKKDKTELINLQTDSLKNVEVYKNQALITELETQISTIKNNPQGWSNGRRTHLRTFQLKSIEKLANKKDTLRNQLQANLLSIEEVQAVKLANNAIVKKDTAEKFYKLMALVMLAQFLVTAILLYLYFLIRNQEAKDAVINEDLKEIQAVIEENASNAMYNGVVNMTNRLSQMLNTQITNNNTNAENNILKITNTKKTENTPNFENPPEVREKKPARIAGFNSRIKPATKPVLKPAQKPATKTSTQSRYLDGLERINKHEISYLQKHKNIVISIKKNVHPVTEKISNQSILNIQKDARTNQKSRSLVQRVFLSMLAVGFDNIDENGNIKEF